MLSPKPVYVLCQYRRDREADQIASDRGPAIGWSLVGQSATWTTTARASGRIAHRVTISISWPSASFVNA
jgi:hypothetical protein